jgi:alcohol-forming fatty acyl-CoA reductase
MTTAPADTFRRTGEEAPLRSAPALGGQLRDLLAGKKLVITGITGFIGEQLLWKILTELPDTRPSVLVRRKGSASAQDRVAGLLRKPIFADPVEAAGGVEALLQERIEVIEGDLPNVPELPVDLDVVVHCAGDVSFDPPIDQAFTTNVVGTQRLLERMLEAVRSGGTADRVPHYVHISTAYTAGRRRGAIPEGPHEHSVDYRAETEAGLRMRQQVEAESRTPDRLAALRKLSEREHRRAGYLATAADTERRRLEWVEAELVKAGAERARSLGWTDVYTFTKALGEAAVVEAAADIRVSIVRPAIVESSWKHPYPGWIEGFKMAEPLILAYGRGELPDFPASPDSVIDVVPCDYVVNAIVAVCATEPPPGDPAYYHVSSGARNPLTFRGMYGHIRNYFLAHPLERTGKASGPLPEWQFPGAASVERLLTASERVYRLADAVVTRAPRSEQTREFARNLDRRRRRLTFVRRYQSLYNEYSQSELHFVDDHTLALSRALHPEDQDGFAFDTAVFDWKTYIEDVHCPSVTASVRKMDTLRGKRGTRPTTMKDLSKDTAGAHAIAVFDLDGTIMSTNVVEQYLWARLPELPPLARLAEVAQVTRRLPGYLLAEQQDRGSFIRAVYRRYKGLDLAELERRVDTTMAPAILSRLSAEAVQRIGEHRAAGHTTILITGAVKTFTRPLREFFDVIVASELATDADGRCTGFLATPPLVGESRAAWLKHYAALHDIDLSRSFAYADSHSDLPMLETVGNPVVVSPDIPLMRAAQRNSWSIVPWQVKPVTPRWQIPR